MNRSVPWSIEDISAATRTAAKEAARRAGLSLSEWLDTVIAERATELGVPKSSVDDRDRMAAVATKLSRLSDRQSGSRTEAVEDDYYTAIGTQGQALSGEPRASAEAETDPLRAMSQRLAAFERRASSRGGAATARREEVSPEPAANARKAPNAMMREAVAEIARRQAALEGEGPQAAPAASDAYKPARRQAAPEPISDALYPSTDAAKVLGRDHPADAAVRRAVSSANVPGQGATAASAATTSPANSRPAAADRFRAELENAVAEPRPQTPSVLEDLKRDVRLAIKEIDPRPNVDELDRQIREIGRRIETIGAMMPPGDLLSVIGDQTREMHDLITQAATERQDRMVEQTHAVREMRAVGAEGSPAPELLPRHTADAHDRPSEPTTPTLGEISHADYLEEVRSLLGRIPTGSALDALDRRIQDLSAKIDANRDDPALPNPLDDLSRRIDEIQSSIAMAPASSLDVAPLEQLVQSIADRIEDAKVASTGIQTIERMMETLAAKIDTGFPVLDVEALEAQINRLGDRLERSEASLTALDKVEHTLGELFSQLEETRHAAIDAAEHAARTAARDTLRAAMQNAPSPVQAIRPDAIDQVTQGLDEVRQHYEDSDRRIQATLGSLHQTMEHLVEHLAKLDTAGRSSGPSAAPAPLAGPPPARAATIGRPEDHPIFNKDNAPAPAVQAEPSYRERFRQEKAGRRAEIADEDIDSLIEPGAGRSLREPGVDEASSARPSPQVPVDPATPSLRDGEGPAAYIAAARRAAQSAQASAAAQAQTKMNRTSGGSRFGAGAPVLDRARQFLAQRRRPLLLSLASIVVLLGAVEVFKAGLGGVFLPASDNRAETSTLAPPAAGPVAQDEGAATRHASVADVRSAGKTEPGASARTGNPPGGAPAATSANTADDPSASKTAAVKPNTNPFLSGLGGPADGLSDNLRKLAASGDPAAQYEVGLRFAEGRTVTRDWKIAEAWFEKAAAQGLAPAQYRVGLAFEKGIGVNRDPALAMAWYAKAADAGNVKAMHNLAVMSADGSVGKSDYARAATYFGKAAGFGLRDSQFNLAILCAKGLGVEQSLVQSYMWFATAAAQGDDDAAKKRDEVAGRLDAAALASAKDATSKFRPAAPISAANEVSAPPGGWDAAATPTSQTGVAPKVSVM